MYYLVNTVDITRCSLHARNNASQFVDIIFNKPYDKEAFKLLKPLNITDEGSSCVVTFLIDPNGVRYVLKQVKNSQPEEQVKLVYEYIASIIGIMEHIPIPKTYLIPRSWDNKAKIYPERVAILQVAAPGTNIQHSDLHLKQKKCKTKDGSTGSQSTPFKDENLILKLIDSMNRHDDLCNIVAFDTFVNNCDRSKDNIYYDSVTKKYYPIDHLDAFSKANLAQEFMRQLSCIINELTSDNINTLEKYANALKRFYHNYPPHVIIDVGRKLFQNLFPEYTTNADVLEMLTQLEISFKKNYADAKVLGDYIIRLKKKDLNLRSKL